MDAAAKMLGTFCETAVYIGNGARLVTGSDMVYETVPPSLTLEVISSIAKRFKCSHSCNCTI